MAKLVDALGLGPSGVKPMEVRLLSSAPNKIKNEKIDKSKVKIVRDFKKKMAEQVIHRLSSFKICNKNKRVYN